MSAPPAPHPTQPEEFPPAAPASAGLWFCLGGVALAITLLRAVIMALKAGDFHITDPDTLIRLARLRAEIISGQTLHDLADGNLGLGLSLHWSHMLEWALYPFVQLVRPLVGLDRALLGMGALVGPLSLAGLTVGLCWAVAPLARQPRTAGAVALLTALAPPLLSYGALGVGDHHIALVLGAVLAWGAGLRVVLVSGDAPDSRAQWRRGAVALGGLTGLAVWLSVESLPYCLLAYLGVSWACLSAATPAQRRGLADALVLATLVLILVQAAVILIDPPRGGLGTADIDRLSHIYLWLAAAGMVGVVTLRATAGVARNGGAGLAIRLGVPLLALTAAALAWLWAFHKTLGPLYTVMAPSITAHHWDHIGENQPVAGTQLLLAMAGHGIAGILAGALTLRAGGHRQGALALLLGAAPVLALGLLHLRFSPYLAALGIAGLALAHDHLFPRHRLAAAALLALALGVPTGVASLLTDTDMAGLDNDREGFSNPCDGEATRVVGSLKGEIVLAHVNDSPHILFWSPGVKVVGANYHRSLEGLEVNDRTWLAPPAQARDEMIRQGIRWVVACPREAPAVREPEAGMPLGRFLSLGGLPPWLRPVTPFEKARQPILYAVTP